MAPPSAGAGRRPHLSGLEADGLQGSKGQVALVGELGEPTDDSVTEITFICSLFQGCSHGLLNGVQTVSTAVSPSCTWLPVGGVESRESRDKVTPVRRSSLCCQRLWDGTAGTKRMFVCVCNKRVITKEITHD